MDKAIKSFYQELLREAHKYRVSFSTLTKLNKRMEGVKCGKTDPSKVIILLIREIEKAIRRNSRGRVREEALISMGRKRDRFTGLQKELIYG